MWMKYQPKMRKDEMSIGMMKNPWCNQYVAPQGYHFVYDGQNLGRIVWISNNRVDGYWIEKDED